MKKSTRDTIIFCIICGLSATLVLIIFTIKRVDDPKSEMTKEEENEGFQSGCQYWHFTNDQVCDDEANTEECNFDFGDCCDYKKKLKVQSGAPSSLARPKISLQLSCRKIEK